jgi:hypothetical protein
MGRGCAWKNIKDSSGIGMLTAGLILAVMVLPFITSITLMQQVPVSAEDSTIALKFFDWAYSKGDKTRRSNLQRGESQGEEALPVRESHSFQVMNFTPMRS